MLRKEQNDLLTQTGPGTPMGNMFRCYWIPALLAEELPENESPPVRVKLLSERLLAFPTPVVIACPGHAIAMGLFLLLSGDLRIGAEGRFKLVANEVAIGMKHRQTTLVR